MDEDENNDDNVWNAAGVILDIDSGMLNEIIYLFFFFPDKITICQTPTGNFSS